MPVCIFFSIRSRPQHLALKPNLLYLPRDHLQRSLANPVSSSEHSNRQMRTRPLLFTYLPLLSLVLHHALHRTAYKGYRERPSRRNDHDEQSSSNRTGLRRIVLRCIRLRLVTQLERRGHVHSSRQDARVRRNRKLAHAVRWRGRGFGRWWRRRGLWLDGELAFVERGQHLVATMVVMVVMMVVVMMMMCAVVSVLRAVANRRIRHGEHVMRSHCCTGRCSAGKDRRSSRCGGNAEHREGCHLISCVCV